MPSTIMFRKPADYWQVIQRHKEVVLRATQQAIRHHQNVSKKRYDHNRVDPIFNVGDLVYIKVCGDRTKMDSRYEGPFNITKKIGRQTFLVEDKVNNRHVEVHSNQMRPAIDRYE
jgi:hypothetical protein